MLSKVKTTTKHFKEYKGVISNSLYDEVVDLAKELRGAKVVMVNATPQGGGVAEILKSLIPLMNDIGLLASWHVIPPDKQFFNLTKNLHNALQGKEFTLSFSLRKLYHRHMERTAALMQDMKPDIWVIHDPQPAGIANFLSKFHPAVSHIHIDTSRPNKEAWEFLRAFLANYDRIIFSMKNFVGQGIPKDRVKIFPPAIDALTEKNQPLPLDAAKKILQKLGINISKPLVTQVSRFDLWKDPLGVVKAYRLAKKKIPNLQLALVGLILAHDDPEAIRILQEVRKQTLGDPSIFLFSDPRQLGSLSVDAFVNAFQVVSDAIIQKSIKEGFGLVVAEAMWKGRPVIGGNVGGIKIQIEDGKNGFLVSSPDQAAKRIIHLIGNPKLSHKMGAAGRESVRKKFLLPRLLRDYLKLLQELV